MTCEISLRIGVSIRHDWPIENVVTYAKLAEKLGFHRVWTNGRVTSRDQLIVLTHVASSTDSIAMGSAVLDPYSRHPVALAASISTISSLINREFIIGIGSSWKGAIESLGIDFATPVETCKEAVILIRRLLRGETVNFEGSHFRVKDTTIQIPSKSKVRVLVGAQGPKFVRMSGEYADGLIVSITARNSIEEVMRTFSEGVKASGRKLDEVRVVGIANIIANEDEQIAIESAKISVAETLSHLSAFALQRLGIKRDDAIAYRNDPSSMPDRLSKQLSICGNADSCIKQLRDLDEIGVEEVFLHSISPFNTYLDQYYSEVVDNTERIATTILQNLNRETS